MLALRIALRYLFSPKSHGAVNVISLVSMAGVAVAAAAIVCVLSVFNGFSRVAMERVSFVDPQLKIVRSDGRAISDGDSLAAALARVPGVSSAMPIIEEMGLGIFHERQMPVRFKGVPEGYDSVSSLGGVIIDGDCIPSHSDDCALVSVGVAMGLEARPGYYDALELYVPRRSGRINPANPAMAFRGDSLRIGAVFQTDDAEIDADLIYIPLSSARVMLGYDSEATAIEVALRPGADENEAVESLRAEAGSGMEVLTRLQQKEESFRMIEIEKWVTFMMLAFILVIASFNIISTVSMLIIEKTSNIATLRAMGASQRFISSIFTAEGALVTAAGGIAGTVLGTLMCLAQETWGFIKLGGDHTKMSIDAYPVALEWTDVTAVAFLILLLAVATSILARLIVPKKDCQSDRHS